MHFAGITETWFKGGEPLIAALEELEDSKGIRILHKSRDSRGSKNGGGVALAFNSGTCNFRRRDLKLMDLQHEVLCPVGRVAKIPRKVVVFVVYVPPSVRVAEFTRLSETLMQEIAAIKSTLRDPVIYVTGDFNKKNMGPDLEIAGGLELDHSTQEPVR